MILITKKAQDIMHHDAAEAYPDECCGFMFGAEDAEGNRTISDALAVNNSSGENKKRRFVISPKDYLRAENFALEKDVQLLGVYHSHPDHPALPSEHDRVAAQPFFSYIIISVLKGTVDVTRSWRLNAQSQFEEEKINHHSTINR